DHQQAEYQQDEYQQGEYQQDEYQHADYQQSEYQQGEYQHEHAAEDHQNDANQQPPTEPGVLPVSGEYQGQSEYHEQGDQQQQQQHQQHDNSAGNNAWWGNGNGSHTDINAAGEQPAALDHGTQEPVQEEFDEGQFISFGAVPTIPSFGQPAVPVNNNNNNNNQPAFDDGDDLGFGNNALKKDKPTVAEEADATSAQQANTPAGDDSDESKGTWLLSKLNIFSGEKRESTPKAVKANLGEESSFYYDNERKQWVNKKAGSESPAAAAESLPPPPSSGSATPPAAASGGPPRAGAGSVARRGARSRYVDVLNTN
ncbi:hypothetical protein BGZ65_011405, partial [Modicella reniformis]